MDIQEKKYTKSRISKSMRIAVWNKYVGEEIAKTKCLCCGNFDINTFNFECGHVIAESKGGETSVENLRPICSVCNKSMGTNNLLKFQNVINDNNIILNFFKQKYDLKNTEDLDFLIKSKDFSIFSICLYIKIFGGDRFVYVNDSLYCFADHKWHKNDSYLKNFISFDIYNSL